MNITEEIFEIRSCIEILANDTKIYTIMSLSLYYTVTSYNVVSCEINISFYLLTLFTGTTNSCRLVNQNNITTVQHSTRKPANAKVSTRQQCKYEGPQ